MLGRKQSNIRGEMKDVRRSERAVLATITNKAALINVDLGQPSKPRATKLAARRLLKLQHEVQQQGVVGGLLPMDVDAQPSSVEQNKYMAIVERRVAEQRMDKPPGIQDIDAEDQENPQLCAEYAPEMYAYLRQLEMAYCTEENYLSGTSLTGNMRTVLVDWLVDVQQQFKLLPETLYLTISIIDRFLTKEGMQIVRNTLQLVGVAAMFLASKLEEIYAPELNDFVYITDSAYTAQEVRDMELRIFKGLEYRVCDPLSINFLRRLSKAGDVDITHHALAKYILESTLLDYRMVSVPASLCAATSLYMSLCVLEEDMEAVWSPALYHYSGYTKHLVHSMSVRMVDSLKAAHTGKFVAVKTKYSSRLFQQIALHPQLKLKLSKI